MQTVPEPKLRHCFYVTDLFVLNVGVNGLGGDFAGAHGLNHGGGTGNRIAPGEYAVPRGAAVFICHNSATGVIISSHNLNHTVDVCPRIALLENGVIIRDIRNDVDAGQHIRN